MRKLLAVGLLAGLATSGVGVSAAQAAGPAATPNRPSDNTHCLTPQRCYSALVVHKSGASSKCVKAAAAAGLTGAGVTVALTSPIDFPGVIGVGSVTFAGTLLFCEVGWY
jgi:hypothetical protein